MSDRIPSIGFHRGIALHDHQDAARLEIVCRQIDGVLALKDPSALFNFAADIAHAPEARMLAGAKCEAAFTLAVEERRQRPDVDLLELQAHTAGLDSRTWRSPTHYCVLPDAGHPRAVPRAMPLDDGE